MSSFRTSNHLSDCLMALLTGDEWKVVYYTIRRTFGLNQPEGNRISIREYADGHADKGVQKDYGTGLSRPSVSAILVEMKKYGVIVEVAPRDEAKATATMYRVESDPAKIDLDGLELRREQRHAGNLERTARARASKSKNAKSAPSVGQTGPSGDAGNPDTTPSAPQTPLSVPLTPTPCPVSPTDPDPASATSPAPSVGQTAYKERQGYRQGKRKGGNTKARLAPAPSAVTPKERKHSKKGPMDAELAKSVNPMLDYLAARVGALTDRETQSGAVRWLLEEGHPVEVCCECLDWQVDNWTSGRISWLSVQKHIGSWLLTNANASRAAPISGLPAKIANGIPAVQDWVLEQMSEVSDATH